MNYENAFTWNNQDGRGFFPVKSRGQYDRVYWNRLLDMKDTPIGQALVEARVRLVDNYCKGEVVLDFGAGSGAFTLKRGLKITQGYDVNPLSVKWLKSNKVWKDPYSTSVVNVSFWDALEHIEKPQDVLKMVLSHVFVSIPIFTGRDQVLASKHFRPTEHFHYFTSEGFRRWMLQLGFFCLEENMMETSLGREGIGTFVFKRTDKE